MGNIIEIRDLVKNYNERRAVDGISFNVKKGEILGFLGPNGAGKSTTINIISTVLEQAAGEIIFEGKNIQENLKYFKNSIGIVPQDLAIYEDITAIENLKFFASLYGISRKEVEVNSLEALRFVGLLDRANDKPYTFSGGMKRRLNIACALSHKPKLIIMDEPTVGIDPQSRNYILDSIKELKKMGVTVIYTTHYMEEVEEIANRVIIVDKGKIISDCNIEDIRNVIKTNKIIKVITDNFYKDIEEEVLAINGVKSVVNRNGEIEFEVAENFNALGDIFKVLLSNGIVIKDIIKREKNLENVFLSLTGKSLRD